MLRVGVLAVQEGALIVLRDLTWALCYTACCYGCNCHARCGVVVMVITLYDVAVMVAVVAPHGTIAVAIIIMSLWPHHNRAIGAQQLDCKRGS